MTLVPDKVYQYSGKFFMGDALQLFLQRRNVKSASVGQVGGHGWIEVICRTLNDQLVVETIFIS